MRAMILAAGRGERMRPLTDTTPKPLLQAGGKPLIVWHIQRLAAAGIGQLVINHAWLGEQIVQALGDGRRYGADIRYSAETEALETAGGIVRTLDFFQGRPFLVINGDVWCDWDPAQAPAIAAAMQSAGRLAWLLLVDNPPQHPGGDFRLDGQGMVHELEPQAEVLRKNATPPAGAALAGAASAPVDGVAAASNLTFSGIGIYHPDLFQGLPPGRKAPLAPLLRQAMRDGKVCGARHEGVWVDVGTPDRLSALDARLRAG